MSRIPDYILEEIKQKISISEIVSEHVTLHRKGGRLWGLCPFHDEKTPSFSVQEEKGFYHCFGCGKGGSVFNFVMEIDHLDFIEAVRLLADKAGVKLEEETDEDREKRSDKKSLLELYNRLAESFHYIFLHKQEAEYAKSYTAGRSISDSAVSTFKIGYAPSDPNWLWKFLKSKKYDDDFLGRSGVFSRNHPTYPLFRNRLMFPIYDQSGNVVAFGGRALDENNNAKYLNTPETEIFHKKEHLFGLYHSLPSIKKSNTFIICEGYFDVIALHEAGITNVVAPLGTAFTEEQAKKMKRYANSCQLLFDSDAAGQHAAVKAASLLEKLEVESNVIHLEQKDPAEILQNSGSDVLKNIVKNSINSFTYMINRAKNMYDHTTPDGKLSIFNEVRPYLQEIQSEIKLSSSIKTLADEIDVAEETIRSDLKRQRSPVVKQQIRERVSVHSQDISLELYLMLIIVNNRETFLEARRMIHLDELQDFRAKEIYTALEECLRAGETSFENLLMRIEHPDVKELLQYHYGSDEFAQDEQELADDVLKRFKLAKLEGNRRELIRKIRQVEQNAPSDIHTLQDLLYEKKYIDEEIAKIRN